MKFKEIFFIFALLLVSTIAIDPNSEEYTKFLDSITPENIQLKMTAPFLDQNSQEEFKLLKEMEKIHENLNLGKNISSELKALTSSNKMLSQTTPSKNDENFALRERLSELEKKFQNQVFTDQSKSSGFLNVISEKKDDAQLISKQKRIKEMAEKLSEKSQNFNKKFRAKVVNTNCLRKDGYMKVREADQTSKEVPLSFAILSKNRLSYFLDPTDETSIQGSIHLGDVYTPLSRISGYPSCFEIRTRNGIYDCAVCLEKESLALEWISALTQNIINCN